MDPIKITFHTLLSVSIFLIFYSHVTLNMFTTLSIEHVISCFTNRQAMLILLNFIILLLTGESGLLFSSPNRAEDHHTESYERSSHREVPPMESKSIDEREMVVHGEEVEASVESLDLVLVEVEEEEEEVF
ncbi:hypothetical protein QJS10_CPB15g01634 [Acorus calamus]|uniref:Transmembrane protein n=1 Tax=Acorus calamus TaxID=4465 RepID=A0AAV9D7Z2_ACOCL|nr:hypothetical protein QJS10_CPB15g01634 [Acorus calamus]